MRRENPENLQHQAEHTHTRRRMSVMGYLMILFAVAFLLLLLAYFQQQRANSEATDALKQSVSTVESIQNLIADNENLRQQVEELEKDNSRIDREAQVRASEADRLSRQVEAMQWFWQIDDYYARGSYRKARELIEQFEALGLKASLPAENTTGTDRFSPADRYQEIYDALY